MDMKVYRSAIHFMISIGLSLAGTSLALAEQMPSLAVGAASKDLPQIAALSLYAESYLAPFQKDFVHFQRLRADFKNHFSINNEVLKLYPSVFIENYKDQAGTNTSLDLGYRAEWSKVTFLASARRERLGANSVSVARAGLVYGNYVSLPLDQTFLESYIESFYTLPEQSSPFASLSAWSKAFYRYGQLNGFSFDPAVISIRVYDNTNRFTAGPDYRSLQLGLQGSYYQELHQAGATLMLMRSYTESQTAKAINDYWILFALGVAF